MADSFTLVSYLLYDFNNIPPVETGIERTNERVPTFPTPSGDAHAYEYDGTCVQYLRLNYDGNCVRSTRRILIVVLLFSLSSATRYSNYLFHYFFFLPVCFVFLRVYPLYIEMFVLMLFSFS